MVPKRRKYTKSLFVGMLALMVIQASLSLSSVHESGLSHLSKLSPLLRQSLYDGELNDTAVVVIKLERADSVDYEHGLVVDRLKSHAAGSQHSVLTFLRSEKGAQVLNSFWITNAVLANVTIATLQRLASLSSVNKVFENFEIVVSEPFNKTDELASSSGMDPYAGGVTWGLDRIDAPEAWGLGYNGSGVRACVLDTGADISHPDLDGKMWTDDPSDPTFPGGWIEFDWSGNVISGSTPYDSDGHGTHTSGTVVGGNWSGVAIGVAPAAWLMHGLILPGGSGSFAQCIAGMQWAVDPFDQHGIPAGERADVVSMSWGSSGYYDEMIEPIENMEAAGGVPVASIGNSGQGFSGSPGNVFGSIAVGATDASDLVAGFSSGEVVDWPASHPETYVKPDFSAPGVNVYSSVPSGWDFGSGTSMAAPHVAGAVALMLEANRNLTVNDVYLMLRAAVDDLGVSGKDVRYGWGVINAHDAVALAEHNCGVKGYVSDAATLLPLTWAAHVQVLGVAWGSERTGDDGSFRIWLHPDTYTVAATAFGYVDENSSATIFADQWTELNFSLTPTARGSIFGRVTDMRENSAIANATVKLLETPLMAVATNETGHYEVEVPVGAYDVDFWAWSYKPATFRDVAISENQTLAIDAKLNATIKAAVLGDFRGQVVDLLMRNISAQGRDWDLIQEIYLYDVVIVNVPSDPGEQAFLDLIAAADQYGVSLVFANTYPGPWASYGISLLQKYAGDPEGSYHAFWGGTVYYTVELNHPIFEDYNVGDKILLINGGDDDFAWFYRYSGMTIADIGCDVLGVLGGGIAYTARTNGNVHVLLCGLSQNTYTNIDNAWTDDAKGIYRAAVMWASNPTPLPPVLISATPNMGVVGTKVAVNGSGFAEDSDIFVKFDDTLIAAVRADGNGSFSAIFNIPLAEAGIHTIKALDSFDNQATLPFTINPGSVDKDTLTVKVTAGSIHVTGERAEFYVHTTINGIPINVNSLVASIFLPDRTSCTLVNEQIDIGLYTVSFNIPFDAPNGTYALRVQASWGGINGSAISSFLVSPTLTTWNAVFLAIDDDLAIIQTDLGLIKTNFTQINAEINLIQDDMVVVKTDIGEMRADLNLIQSLVESFNTSLVEIRGGIATLQTEIGQIQANLTFVNANVVKVEDDVAIIRTDVGQIKVDLDYARSVIENGSRTLIKIEGDIVTLKTAIGEIKGAVSSVRDGVAMIETDLGQIKVNLPNFAGGTDSAQGSMAQMAILMFFGGIIIIAFILTWSYVAIRPKPPS